MQRRANLPQILLAFAGIYLIWGTTYLGITIVIRTLPPFAAGAIRYLSAGALMYLWLRSREPRPFDGLNIAGTLFCGALMSGVGNGFVMWAQQGLPSGVTALFVASLPMWILLADWAFFYRRAPAALAALGVLLGLGGVTVLAAYSRSFSGQIRPAHIVAVMLAQVAWALATLLQRRYVSATRVVSFTCLQMLSGGVFQLLLALVSREWIGFSPQQVSGQSIVALCYLCLVGSVVGTTCYSYLIAHVSAHKVSTYALVNPVIALALGALILHEKITSAALVASALVLLGVALVLFQGFRARRELARLEVATTPRRLV